MKRQLLPLAVAAAIAMPYTAVAEGHKSKPKVYGKVQLSYGINSYDATDVGVDNEELDYDNVSMENHASRLGVKGKEQISESLQAIYKLEYGADPTSSDTFSQRNIYGGLKGGWGSVRVGYFDSPLKVAQGKIDLFNDIADLKATFVGEERLGDQINYTSPKFADMVSFSLSIAPGEESEADVGTTEDVNDSFADSISMNVVFDQGPIYAAFAYDNEVVTEVNPGDAFGDNNLALGIDRSSLPLDSIRLVGMYKTDMFQVGAMFQQSELSDDDGFPNAEAQTAYLISGAFFMGPHAIKAQFSASDMDASLFTDDEIDDVGGLQTFVLGYDYKLSKRTKVFGYYASYDSDVEDSAASRIAGGLTHNF